MKDINLDKQKWKEKKDKLKQRHEELTDEDLNYVVGEEDELVNRIQQRLGTSEKETRNLLRRL